MNNALSIKINIYGAFDRFNYGDLLFPIIIKKALDERIKNLKYEYYGLIDSNLSKFGGVPTVAIKRRLYAKPSGNQKEVFIIAGGEILSTSMFFIHQCLINNDFARKLFFRLYKFFGSDFSNSLSRMFLGKDLIFPFIINKNQFPGVSSIIYNAVGGKLPDKDRDLIFKYLDQADYISVRDVETQKSLNELNPDIESFLFPDSAVVMSKYFTKDFLDGKIRSETRNFLINNKKGYICFQINASSYRLSPDIVRDQLAKLSKKTGLLILLLPMGRAPWHHDQYALKSILTEAQFPCFMPSENTIYDIMALIAYARIFIGTSLHGAITSISYSVPYLSINPQNNKVKRYLKTWSNSKYNSPVKFEDISETALLSMDSKKPDLKKESQKNIIETDKNFDSIVKIIEKTCN